MRPTPALPPGRPHAARLLQVVCMSFYDIVLDFILMDAFEDLENPPSSVLAVLRNRWLSDSFKETVGGCPQSQQHSRDLTVAWTPVPCIPGFGHQGWAPHPSDSSHSPGQAPVPSVLEKLPKDPLPSWQHCKKRVLRLFLPRCALLLLRWHPCFRFSCIRLHGGRGGANCRRALSSGPRRAT